MNVRRQPLGATRGLVLEQLIDLRHRAFHLTASNGFPAIQRAGDHDGIEQARGHSIQLGQCLMRREEVAFDARDQHPLRGRRRHNGERTRIVRQGNQGLPNPRAEVQALQGDPLMGCASIK